MFMLQDDFTVFMTLIWKNLISFPFCWISLRQLIGFGLTLLTDVDPNPDNFVGAGIIHTQESQIGCLLRLEPSKNAKVSHPTTWHCQLFCKLTKKRKIKRRFCISYCNCEILWPTLTHSCYSQTSWILLVTNNVKLISKRKIFHPSFFFKL